MANAAPQTPPKGFSDASNPDVDGWYKAEKGSVVHGKIVGHLIMQGDNGPRQVILVKIRDEVKGYQKGDDKGKMLKVGDVLGVSVSHDIKEALKYVENRGEVWLNPTEKKKLAAGRSMWKFQQAYKGTKAAPPTVDAVTAAGTADDDDIPF